MTLEGTETLRAKLDRLSRSLIDVAQLLERSEGDGWKLVSHDPDADLTTPTGEYMATMLAAMAR